jgi:predicted permease
VAIRSALGAVPRRLVQQVLTESLLLSLLGGVLGLAFAWWGTSQLTLVAGAQLPRAHEVDVDWRVFLFSLTACVAAGLLFGLAPAAMAIRADALSVLQESGGHSTLGPRLQRLRDGLVIAEVAMAFVLAVGATLLVRELVRLRNIDPGMVTANVVTFHIGHRPGWWGRERRGAPPAEDVRPFYEIADRVGRLPGVRAAGFIQIVPLQNWGWQANSSDFTVRGRAAAPSTSFAVELRYVTPGYFQALGIPILKGRGFTGRDDRDAPPVILINGALARRFFGSEDPIGLDTTRGTIVGVVGDVRQVSLDRSALPEIYYPIAQNYSHVLELGMSLVVRTQGPPEPLIAPIRSVIRDVDPNQAVFNVKTLDDVIADSLSGFTLYLSLIGSFAALALLLASTGAYGVISYVATSRMREFAVRVALGADRTRVTGLVLRQGIRLTGIGLAVGVFGTRLSAPLLQGLPVSVRPPDFITVAAVIVLIGITAVAACLVPACRAANVDPMSVLRTD